MARQLTQDKREQLFQQFVKNQSQAYVAKLCGCCENTVAKYRRIDKWDARLAKIHLKATKKADETVSDTRARWATMGRALQKAGAEFLFDHRGQLRPEAKKMLSPKDAIKAMQIGVEIEQAALGDQIDRGHKPVLFQLVGPSGQPEELPPPKPPVIDAEFEGKDGEDEGDMDV